MARRPIAEHPKRHAQLSAGQIPIALSQLRARLKEIHDTALDPQWQPEDISACFSRLRDKTIATFRTVFGEDTVEGSQTTQFSYSFLPPRADMYNPRPSFAAYNSAFEKGKKDLVNAIQTHIEMLAESISVEPEDVISATLRAHASMQLHPAVEAAAGELYKDGHYANSIEDAVKALNNLVRLKSGNELDGDKLMTTVFSPEKPILQFNEMQDASDKDEQRGFMMLFAGAVAGLRNPRAHKLIKDDPERALEFIAFVSLLAKLLDGAKKVRRPAD